MGTLKSQQDKHLLRGNSKGLDVFILTETQKSPIYLGGICTSPQVMLSNNSRGEEVVEGDIENPESD